MQLAIIDNGQTTDNTQYDNRDTETWNNLLGRYKLFWVAEY